MEPGYITRSEIFSQPQAWSAALEVVAARRQEIAGFQPASRYDHVLFTGCGSSYYLSLAAASLAQELTGCACRAFPASELWLYPRASYPKGRILLVAASRSGETGETLHACRRFLDEGRGDLLTLSCYADGSLARMGNLNVVLPSGREQSVVQTRAFTGLYLAAVALAVLWSGRSQWFDALSRLPGSGERLLQSYSPLAEEVGRDLTFDRFFWLGSGPRFGLACELSLKMMEMSLSFSEPFSFLEFRHGPKTMIAPSALTVGLLSQTNCRRETAVLEEIQNQGGKVLSIAEDGAAIRFESGLDEAVRNVLYLPVGQLVALERALGKGIDPDKPANLEPVVRIS